MSTHQSPPTTVITPTDHGGLITITVAVGMTFALCAMLIRAYGRAAINGPWSHDDTALAASTVFCVAQSITKMISVTNGLGKAIHLIDPLKLITVQKTDYASDLLFILAIYFSKASAVFLFLRLTPNKHHVMFCWSIMATSTVWAVASMFAVALRCQLSQPWVMNEHCVHLFLRWQIIGAFDVITEVALFAMAIYLVLDLRMSLQLKVFVVSAFAFRIPVIAFIILRLHYLNIEFISSDPTFNAVMATIWMQVQEDYSIIASTIPCLKPFMIACNTGWGHAAPHTGEGSMGAKSGSYGLNSLSKTGARNTVISYHDPLTSVNHTTRGGDSRDPIIHPTHQKSPAALHDPVPEPNPDEAAQSIASNDSQQMIIRHEVGWTVTYDDDSPGENSHGQGQGHIHSSHRSDVEAQGQGQGQGQGQSRLPHAI